MSIMLFCSKCGKRQTEFTIKNSSLICKECWERESVNKNEFQY
jgi:recombinational DNA repair protein (RecF pathway)